MKLPRRKFFHLAAAAAALPAVSRIARAQAYPTRPVRIVVGFPAGGGADIVARLIGQWPSERLGQQFIVENRPGAGSNIAAEAVVRAFSGSAKAANIARLIAWHELADGRKVWQRLRTRRGRHCECAQSARPDVFD